LRETKLWDQQENSEERNKAQRSSHKAPEVLCPKSDRFKARDL
jgi:hypothetical protein